MGRVPDCVAGSARRASALRGRCPYRRAPRRIRDRVLLRGAPAEADPQPGDLTLVRITVDDLEVPTADAIQVLRFGEFTPTPATPAHTLHVGDEILCPDVRVAVRLTGIDGQPQVNMRGPFRVALGAAARRRRRPVINLLGGEVHVSRGEPTSVRAGEVMIGSRGTVYGVGRRRGRHAHASRRSSSTAASPCGRPTGP